MNSRSRFARPALCAAIALVSFLLPTSQSHAYTITLRSGNGVIGNPDAVVKFNAVASGSCGVGFAAAVGLGDFAAAQGGVPAFVVPPFGPWLHHLTCDSLAQWNSINANSTPLSALYAYTFFIPAPCCFTRATLDFCWVADDALGDAINPAGVYLNGVPIPAIAGGNYATEMSVNGIDVLPMLQCGQNTLYVYDRDIACVVSGVMFSATINAKDCFTAAQPSTWCGIKSLYR